MYDAKIELFRNRGGPNGWTERIKLVSTFEGVNNIEEIWEWIKGRIEEINKEQRVSWRVQRIEIFEG